MPPTTPRRRIKSADVRTLSLCARAKNQMPVLYKADGSLELAALVKYGDERGELLALGYVPDAADADGDIASPDAVRSMAHSHMRNGAGLDIQHDGKTLTKAQAFVAESYIVPAGDPRFANWRDRNDRPVDATGAWGLLVKIEDPELRKAYRSGALDGVSLFAPAAEVETIEDRIVEATVKALRGKETDVDLKELTTALAANNEALIAGLAKALKPDAPPAPTPVLKADEAPILKAENRMDPKKVREYQRALQVHELQKATVWTDQASIDTYLEKVAELTKADAPVEKSPEVLHAEAELAAVLKASSQSTQDPKRAATGVASLIKAGLDAADALNEARGFSKK